MGRSSVGKAGGQGFWNWLTSPRQLSVSSDTWTWLAVTVGVVLRLCDYAEFRPLYMDEKSLLENLVVLPVFDFRTTLTEYQLAPPGFLVLERLMVRLPWNNVLEARLFPLACGIASMILFRSAARRYLTPRAVPIATGLFAMADWLIYYSTELKQYSCDLALTLAALSARGRHRGRIRLEFDFVNGYRNVDESTSPRDRRIRSRRGLVLLSAGAGTRRCGDLPDRDGGQPQGLAAVRWPGRDGRGLVIELRGVLRDLAPHPEQGSIHLGLVGLRVLADPPAIVDGPGA